MAKAVKLRNNFYLSTASIVHKRGDKWYYLNDLIDNRFPIGFVYISVDETDPSELFGGTWERIQGRFLLACGQNTANTTDQFGVMTAIYTINPGDMGGKFVHTLTTDEMPSHGHGVKLNVPYGMPYNAQSGSRTGTTGNVYYGESYSPISIQLTGGSQAHTNTPPYLAVYMWKRIA